MTPEERAILERIATLTEENAESLRSIRRSAFIGRLMTLGYWAVIIIASLAAYQTLQPYLDQLQEAYGGGLKSTVDTVRGVGNSLQNLGL
jgi:hypothetical protein